MSTGLYQTHFSRSGDVIHPRDCENLGLGTRLGVITVATILPFRFKFHTLVPTSFLCVKIDFCDLHLFRAVDTTFVNPAGLEIHISPRTSVENVSNSECA